MILEGQIKLCNQHERPSEQLRQLQSEKTFLQSEKQQLRTEKLIYMQSPLTGSANSNPLRILSYIQENDRHSQLKVVAVHSFSFFHQVI